MGPEELTQTAESDLANTASQNNRIGDPSSSDHEHRSPEEVHEAKDINKLKLVLFHAREPLFRILSELGVIAWSLYDLRKAEV